MNTMNWLRRKGGDAVTTEKLLVDLRILAADMEQLLKATAGQTGEQVAQVRARAEASLNAVTARVADLQNAAAASTRAAGRATDAYVRANPWQMMSLCALGGVILGLGLSRGGTAVS